MSESKTNIRPPIVSVMGHVDHGKTTLLDAIRKTNQAAREKGGITQHIGAYQIKNKDSLITFIDTPGHAAFEKMRSRGAEVADIVVLTVAANESVKPQTQEAIKHIKKAQKPLIVAITKTDLENINTQKVKKDLQKEEVVVEQYGGKVPSIEVAAIQNKGIDDLLDVISLVWQLEPEANLINNPLEAVVIESYLDKAKGPIVHAIVKKGTLKTGQKIEVDSQQITIKALFNDGGQKIEEAPPSTPIEILGFKKVLEIGSIIREKIAAGQKKEETAFNHAQIISKARQAKGRFRIIIKADVLGSQEAIKANLPEGVYPVFMGIGDVQAQDVNLAKITESPIFAFNVNVPNNVSQLAAREQVVIRKYDVIYKLIEDLQSIVESFELVKREQKIRGSAKIIAVFDIEGEKIAGAKVNSGKIHVGDKITLKRENGHSKEGKIVSIKKFKKNVEVANQGQEFGFKLDAVDFKEGDIIESVGQNS